MGYLDGFLITLRQHRIFGGERVTTSYSGGRVARKGKKVDGRSDLFSLGVTLYELLTGEKPWKGGEAGIGTLLFQIANDPEPDILTVKIGRAHV